MKVYGRRPPSERPGAAARLLALTTWTACNARSPVRCDGNTSGDVGCSKETNARQRPFCWGHDASKC